MYSVVFKYVYCRFQICIFYILNMYTLGLKCYYGRFLFDEFIHKSKAFAV